jgi:tetratricopeptide (TPR) repeat protein
MSPIAGMKGRLKRVRRAVGRLQQRRAAPGVVAVSAPPVVNLFANPAFRATGSTTQVDGTDVRVLDQPFGAGGLYTHVHNRAYAAEVPGSPGRTGVLVTGVDTNNDTHIAPGGRNAPGEFRLGMKAGKTYTASVSVFLPAPLTGSLNPGALRMVVGIMRGATVTWNIAHSHPARNEYGDHRISVTFTVPAEATGAWIRLTSGMSQGNGIVYWHSFSITETDHPVDYFDGSTPDDAFHEYTWTGEPDASPSRRTLRDPAAIAAGLGAGARQAIADEAVRLARQGALTEADALLAYLGAEQDPIHQLAVAQEKLARGDDAGAKAILQRLVKKGDPNGDAAFQLGLLEEKANAWGAAEQWYRKALARQSTNSLRAYRLAKALDKLKRYDDSRRMSATGLKTDVALPFDGPAVLTMDVKLFGARREVGIFVAEHLEQIRTQAGQRLQVRRETSFDMPVFIYWAQGFDNAPPLVRRCLAELRANNPGADIHELTDANLLYYIDVPADLAAATAGDKTHFSDLIRLALLEKFGGVWVDATCFVSEPLAPRMAEVLEKGSVFAFDYTGASISSWFLASRPDSYLMHMWRAATFLWWEKRGELIDYFPLHHFFEMLVHLDEEFAAEWETGARLSSHQPHPFQFAMLGNYDAETYDAWLAASFAHKLRYRYQPHEVRSDSYLAHFIRGDRPRPAPAGRPVPAQRKSGAPAPVSVDHEA